jgi:hypothetical protein
MLRSSNAYVSEWISFRAITEYQRSAQTVDIDNAAVVERKRCAAS